MVANICRSGICPRLAHIQPRYKQLHGLHQGGVEGHPLVGLLTGKLTDRDGSFETNGGLISARMHLEIWIL